MFITIFNYKLDVQLIILACVIYTIMVCHTVGGCCKKSAVETVAIVTNDVKEGFTNSLNRMGGHQAQPYELGGEPTDPSGWGTPDLSSMTTPAALDILNRPVQPVPMPEGTMSLFDTTKFSMDCCPNTYSSSGGCACMTLDQQNFLTSRGGNHTDTGSIF